MLALLRRPSAFLPVAMSFFVLALILIRIARFGVVREADEGAEAHFFQILMPAQIPIIAFFAFTWLSKNPKPATQVLVLQMGAALAVFATVYLLRL